MKGGVRGEGLGMSSEGLGVEDLKGWWMKCEGLGVRGYGRGVRD